LNGIQADLSFTPQISFADSLNSQSVMLGCIRSRSIRIRIEVIIAGELTAEVIHDVWGSRPACFVYADRRVMGFRRRPGPNQPDAHVIEDVPDDRRVFDAAKEGHD
jgi:hypothetical protein